MASSERKMPRNYRGKQFIKEFEEVDGAADAFRRLAKVDSEPEKDDETIIDIKVQNPLRKIIHILEEIKKHQSTTFSFRFTIPLIALPIFLLIAFQLGRAQTACSQSFTSKIGLIRNVTVDAPKDQPNWWSQLFSFLPGVPPFEKPSDLMPAKRSILVSRDGDVITILPASGISLLSYQNQAVILTGNYSACTHVVTLDSPQNITSFTATGE